MMEKDQVLDFVRKMKPTDHVIMFYELREDKHRVLSTYLKAGLDHQEAAAYVTGINETRNQITGIMKKHGIDVEELERRGMLRIISYKDWYITDGKFSIDRTVTFWKSLLNDALARGFRGLRVVGEVDCFFECDMVKELVEYENSLHRVLDFPLTAMCAYSLPVMMRKNQVELVGDLIKTHGSVIILGPQAGLVKDTNNTTGQQSVQTICPGL